MIEQILSSGAIFIAIIAIGVVALIVRFYKKAAPGEALVRTGLGGLKVYFSSCLVIPVLHKLERMDLTLKKVNIHRKGSEGLVCQDNLRADIQVTFFVQVIKQLEDVRKVATQIGCERASHRQALQELFEAKFSEALKTVGKRFDFVDLYNSREQFNSEVKTLIGGELNGYKLTDCAIDYLEQTPVGQLDAKNILDSEGIKKITKLTAEQNMQANLIRREEEKTITKQDVEARETILELEKQLAEKEEVQKKEVAVIKAREEAEVLKVQAEQALISNEARIRSEEEIEIAEQNKLRQVLVAEKNKERTDAVETERVMREQQLEATEREKIVSLAQIEKEKAVEAEKKEVQEVIRERVVVEKSVVTEQEKIKDTEAFAGADRFKKVTITEAEAKAQEDLVKEIKAAEAARQAAEFKAKQTLIEAEAAFAAAGKQADAEKILAEAEAAKQAAYGVSEAQVIEAKAHAKKLDGEAEADVIRAKADATAEEIAKTSAAKAEADRQLGAAEAEVIKAVAAADQEKYHSEAVGIEEKAAAMKKLDGVGKEHEEFKLRLEKDKEIDLAQIAINKDIADAQAHVISEALQNSKIDIVGGETMFFDKIIGSITKGKQMDRMVGNSEVMTTVKDTFFGDEGGASFKDNVRAFIDKFGLNPEEIKDLSIATLLMKLSNNAGDQDKNTLTNLLGLATSMGVADSSISSLGLLDKVK